MSHPVLEYHDNHPEFGVRLANKVTAAIGSWKFLIIQSVLLFLWVFLNITHFVYHWDEPPFILLNLMLSFQAAFTGPIVLLASNSSYARDHDLWESHYKTTQEILRKLNNSQIQPVSTPTS